ncbi:MAG: hypothetical protein AMXMBFR33_04300 [Candidatus Xenobia bacterium]
MQHIGLKKVYRLGQAIVEDRSIELQLILAETAPGARGIRHHVAHSDLAEGQFDRIVGGRIDGQHGLGQADRLTFSVQSLQVNPRARTPESLTEAMEDPQEAPRMRR